METFIYAKIVDAFGHDWEDEEGCLSLPDMASPVKRPWSVRIEYDDQRTNE